MINRLIARACALALGFTVMSAQPQREPPVQSPAEVLGAVKKKASEIEQLRAALRGPDASERAAAFAAMIDSNNATLVALAISEGHASSDGALRDLATRAAFRELKSFTPEPAGMLSPEAQATFVKMTGLKVDILEYQWTRGTFAGVAANYGLTGQVSAAQLSFTGPICQGNLARVETTWAFEGYVSCLQGGQKWRERMRVQIR